MNRKKDARGHQTGAITPHSGMVPLMWTPEGRVLQWGKETERREGEKIAMCFTSEGLVLLWAYTWPDKDSEFLAWKKLSNSQLEKYNNSIKCETAFKLTRRFRLGDAADKAFSLDAQKGKFEHFTYLIEAADNIHQVECYLSGKPDRWGGTAGSNFNGSERAIASTAKFKTGLANLVGTLVIDAMAERNYSLLESLAHCVKSLRNTGLTLTAHEPPILSNVTSFTGTVYRCYEVLRQTIHYAGVPTKGALREYVRKEWMAMGKAEQTVDGKDFSKALKTLGLSGLPNSPRKRP